MALMLADIVAGDPRNTWAPVVLLIVIGVGFAIGNVLLSLFVGPRRTGPGKEQTYESGMVPIGTAHRRFNVRFYLVGVTFLVFDVEVVLVYPWAVRFPQLAASGNPADAAWAGVLLVAILLFMALLVVAYVYEWGKGVFKWD